MTIVAPLVFTSPTFVLANFLWTDLRRYDGLAMGCGESKDALTLDWDVYDPQFHPDIPDLNRTYERVICEDHLNTIRESDEQMAFVKAIMFYTKLGGQILITIPDSAIANTDLLLKMCWDAGLSQAKKIRPGAITSYKV